MRILTNPTKSSPAMERGARLLRPLMLATALLTSTPALADALDTAFALATYPYAVLKRGTIECGMPPGEYIAYKARVLNILGRIPNIDLIAADREIERAFEREAPRTSSVRCSDALLERYRITLEDDAERALNSLARAVRRH